MTSQFVVTTAAYDQFVAHNGLSETILRALSEHPDSGATIRAAFEGAPIPPEVGRRILAAYQQLSQGPVAVGRFADGWLRPHRRPDQRAAGRSRDHGAGPGHGGRDLPALFGQLGGNRRH